VSGALPADAFDAEALVEDISAWAAVESPAIDAAAVNRMMDVAAARMDRLGMAVTRHAGTGGRGDAVVARSPWDDGTPGVLVLVHLDTVHPVGTTAGPLPVRREGDRLYGPGVYDMKGGGVCAIHALARVVERDGRTPLPVTFLFVGDEELGSPTSRPLIEAEARRHRFVLVPEPAQDAGNLITGRWAFQRFELRTHGRPSHAGATLAEGRSAIREMAEQVAAVEALSDPSRQVTLSVGVLRGGTFVNVVAAECEAEALAVAPTQGDLERVCAQMLALRPTAADVRLDVVLGPRRPLFEPTPAGLELYEHARALAREIGFDPGHGSVGGGSDGNFTGALGIPTLDGLGVCGDGFHTHGEHLEVSSLVPRTRLLSGLLRTLGRT
jgi:glutamate carboxypeptidase